MRKIHTYEDCVCRTEVIDTTGTCADSAMPRTHHNGPTLRLSARSRLNSAVYGVPGNVGFGVVSRASGTLRTRFPAFVAHSRYAKWAIQRKARAVAS